MILTFSPSELSVKSGHTNTIVVKADTRADTWSALSIPSWATVKENRDNSCTITLSPPVGTKADTYQMRIWAEDSLSDDRAVGVMKVRAGDLDDEPITLDQLDAAAKAIKSYVDKVFAARANLRLTRPHVITPEVTSQTVATDEFIFLKKLQHQSINFSISDNEDNDVYPVILSRPDWAWIEGSKLYVAPPLSAEKGVGTVAATITLGLSNKSSSCSIEIYVLDGYKIYYSNTETWTASSGGSGGSGYSAYTITYMTLYTTAGNYQYYYYYYTKKYTTSGNVWTNYPVSPAYILFKKSNEYFRIFVVAGNGARSMSYYDNRAVNHLLASLSPY